LHDIHVAGVSFNGRHTVVPRQLLEAADRLSCDTILIGAIVGNLNIPLKFRRLQCFQNVTLVKISILDSCVAACD